MITALAFLITVLFFQATGTITIDMIVTMLSPLVVFGATALVKWLLPQIQGKWIVTAIVPVLSLIAAYLGTLIEPNASFWVQVVLSLAATWVREVISQWTKQPTPTQ